MNSDTVKLKMVIARKHEMVQGNRIYNVFNAMFDNRNY